MGGVGNDDLGPLGIAPVQMILLHHQQGGELPVSAGGGHKGHAVHSRDLAQQLLGQVQRLQAALDRVGALGGVYPRKAGQGRRLLMDSGIILHRAGAQGIESVVHPVGPPLQLGVVPGEIHLGHLGETQRRPALRALHQVGGRHIQRGQQVAAAPGAAFFKQQFHLSTPPEWPLPARRSPAGCSSLWRTTGCRFPPEVHPGCPAGQAPPEGVPALPDMW